jgi:hypothetical protein
MITTTCPACGREYLTYPCRVANGKRPLCSKACQIKKIPRACTACGKVFVCPAHRICQERVYCSNGCARATYFASGSVPWNKGMEGIHLSPETEFKKGHARNTRMPIGAVRLRTHKGDSRRAWIKIAEPNKWELRAKIVWIAAHGPIPKGMIVHHRDRNTLNDELSNLELMTRADHLSEHREEIRQPR